MIDYTHDNLVSAAEKLLAKVSEVFTHKDLQCCLAIAGIHGYVAKVPSLQAEATALEQAIKESKAKLTAEAKALETKVVAVAEKAVEEVKTLAPVIAADFTRKSLIKK